MRDFLENKVVLVVAVFIMANLLVFLGSKIIIARAADKVIEKLQKEYSPSPYGPGVDPDRFNSDTVKKLPAPPPPSSPPSAKAYMELRTLPGEEGEEAMHTPSVQKMTETASAWREDWEKERGFNH